MTSDGLVSASTASLWANALRRFTKKMDVHDRMPLILVPGDYARWLSEEPDPRDLMCPFPAAPMRMWPISTRVNKPENDDAAIVEPTEVATDVA